RRRGAVATEVLPRLRQPAARQRARRSKTSRLLERHLRLRLLRQSGPGRGGAARARRDRAPGTQQGLAGEVVRAHLRLSREGRIARGRRVDGAQRWVLPGREAAGPESRSVEDPLVPVRGPVHLAVRIGVIILSILFGRTDGRRAALARGGPDRRRMAGLRSLLDQSAR